MVRVHELLDRDGIAVSYTTLRRWARAELGWRERGPTVFVDDPPPGEEAQIDFGLMGYVNAAGGYRRKHARVAPGKRSTDLRHYPVGKAPYASRNVESLVSRSRELGEYVGIYAERQLAGPLPWTRMRQAYGLVRLCERYGSERVDAHCKRALEFEVVDLPRIERMLKQARLSEESAPGKIVALPPGRYWRDAAAFATIKGAE